MNKETVPAYFIHVCGWIVSLMFISSCGSSIKNAQDFVPNKAPVVTDFTVEYIGTDTSYSGSRLYSGMPFLVTVNARDPEGKALIYDITSDQGTFTSQTPTDTGVTCKFYIGAISAGDSVAINLAVIDPKKASFTQSIDVGTGKTGPGITLTPPSNSVISPTGETTMTISCDSKGWYRVFRDNSITSSSDATIGTTGLNSYTLENISVSVKILGPSSSSTNGIYLENNKKNYIWVVFQDNNYLVSAAYCTMYVEGTNPTVTSTAPAGGDTNISTTPTISILFSKALDTSTLTGSNITVSSPSGSVAGTLAWNASTNTETFVPATALAFNTSYTVFVSKSLADAVGNTMSEDKSFSFTTAAYGTLANPEYLPAAGTYTGTRNVTLYDSDSSATIVYTTDGTIPKIDGSYTVTNGTAAASGTVIAVSGNTTVRAFACKSGSVTSGVAVAPYLIKAPAPVFSFAAASGVTTGAGTLTLADSIADATIRYTTDDSDPSGSGATSVLPGAAVAVNANMTVKAIARKTGLTDSAETSAAYSVKSTAPVFSLTASSYDSDQTLYLSSDSGAVIYYTDDGITVPTTSSKVYGWGIPLNGSASGITRTIKAIAVKSGLKQSDLSSGTITIAYGTVATPEFSPAAVSNPYYAAQTLYISCSTPGATIYYTTDGFDPTTSTTTYGPSPITVSVEKSVIIKALAAKALMNSSTIAGRDYVLKVPAPKVYVAGGLLYVSADSNATVYYTTDGTTPGSGKTKYINPLPISALSAKAIATRSGWTDSDIVTGYKVGGSTAYTVSSILFNMINATSLIGGTISFPTGIDDAGITAVSKDFAIAETQTTWELWSVVKTWAGNHGYSFGNSGQNGSSTTFQALTPDSQYPVTNICRRDMFIWCNALTEYYNTNNGTDTDLTCVYYTDSSYTTPLRTSTTTATATDTSPGSQDAPYIKSSNVTSGNTAMANCTATGFRLPTVTEYEYASRYAGTTYVSYLVYNTGSENTGLTAGYYWTPGNYASGDSSPTSSSSTLASYAVYNTATTYPVKKNSSGGTLLPNQLGLFGMSGNVMEICFDLNTVSHNALSLGGGISAGSTFVSYPLPLGYLCVGQLAEHSIYVTFNSSPLEIYGFRVAKNQ